MAKKKEKKDVKQKKNQEAKELVQKIRAKLIGIKNGYVANNELDELDKLL